jgi:2-(3-amino-3-carboxypropyl)histidine synthase
MKKSIKELNENYEIEIKKILKEIKKQNPKIVLLQFPEGLKPYSISILEYLKKQTKNKIQFITWLDSCFGACDTPNGIENLNPKINLLIQFGHSKLMPNY